MQAICIAANNESAAPLLRLWEKVGAWEAEPSMASLGYPPHLTLAIYGDVDMHTLADVARAVCVGVAAMRVRFDAICGFQASPLVLWAKPADASALEGLHRSVHARVQPELCHEHYRPENWIPHCSLGTAIDDAHRDAAQALAEKPLEPFEVLFDTVDCLSYPPVRVHDRIKLVR